MAPIIQSLWIGREISELEKLSMASFLRHGHPFHLYAYRDLKNVPDGVTVKDANEILPESAIFSSRGSYATFADWFRWTLLYENGHYWVDTDIVCLKRFDFEDEIVFGKQDDVLPNVSVLKFPSKHAFSKFMADSCSDPNKILPYDNGKTRRKKYYRKYVLGDRKSNQGWGESGGPHGFKDALIHFNLYDLGKPFTYFYPIHHEHWSCIFDDTLKDDTTLFSDTYALHLWNDKVKSKFDKNARFPRDSLIEQLKRRYL